MTKHGKADLQKNHPIGHRHRSTPCESPFERYVSRILAAIKVATVVVKDEADPPDLNPKGRNVDILSAALNLAYSQGTQQVSVQATVCKGAEVLTKDMIYGALEGIQLTFAHETLLLAALISPSFSAASGLARLHAATIAATCRPRKVRAHTRLNQPSIRIPPTMGAMCKAGIPFARELAHARHVVIQFCCWC